MYAIVFAITFVEPEGRSIVVLVVYAVQLLPFLPSSDESASHIVLARMRCDWVRWQACDLLCTGELGYLQFDFAKAEAWASVFTRRDDFGAISRRFNVFTEETPIRRLLRRRPFLGTDQSHRTWLSRN